MQPCTLKVYEQGYQNLLAVAAVLQATSKHKARYLVKDMQLDYDQQWVWTSICRDSWEMCQVVSPKQWEKIIISKDEDDLLECVKDIKRGKYFDD